MANTEKSVRKTSLVSSASREDQSEKAVQQQSQQF
jgi:hypothetical protein